jgi:hypothetical protein
LNALRLVGVESFEGLGVSIEKGDFAEPARKDHALADELELAWQVLEGHGEAGGRAFESLLSDESRNVRGWVASQLLALGDETMVAVLEADVAAGGVHGFDSEIVLEEWRGGRLKPPLGTVDA